MIMVGFFYWDPNPEIFRIPILGIPVYWYSLFFALGFLLGFPLFVSFLTRFFSLTSKEDRTSLKKKATRLADQLLVYVVLGAILGARLGHFLFYESPSDYLSNPFSILKIWEGGLASHGGIAGVFLGTYLFRRKIKKQYPSLSWIKLLDLFTLPATLIAFLIRIGNFFNQEILGKPTDVPWAVFFGHPLGVKQMVPRHPAQLYEACFYLLLFFLFLSLSFRKTWIKKEGLMGGLLLILLFLFRFFIELFKEKQSHLSIVSSSLNMGGWLSLPFILLGAVLLLRSVKKD